MAFTVTIEKRTAPGKPASKGFPIKVSLSSSKSTLGEVKKQIASSARKLTTERQRITTEDKKPLLDDDKSLADLGVSDGQTLYVKDLGPQIGWKTVFLTEYAGPIFIHPLFYYLGPKIWHRYYVPSEMQKVACGLAVAHYIKRELETLFVHRFSNGTMPLFNIFKNSTHYWLLSGFALAPFHPVPLVLRFFRRWYHPGQRYIHLRYRCFHGPRRTRKPLLPHYPQKPSSCWLQS